MAELRDLPSALVAEYETLTRLEAGRYRRHPNHKDMLSHARYQVWMGLARLDPDRRQRAHPFVRSCARLACLYFLRSGENCQRRVNFQGKPVPPVLQWETVTDASDPYSSNVPLMREWSRLVEPDFAPETIERLWRESLWEEVKETVNPAKRRELWGWLKGEIICGKQGVARYMKFHRLLNAYRRQLGLPSRYLPRKVVR